MLWLAWTGHAHLRIRAADIAGHRRWMTRSLALTLAAVTLRSHLRGGRLLGIPLAEAYQAISWISRAPNLLAAELAIRRRPRHPGRIAA